MSPPGIIHYLLALVGTTPVPTNSITSDELASHSHAEDFRKEGEESAQVWEEVCASHSAPESTSWSSSLFQLCNFGQISRWC